MNTFIKKNWFVCLLIVIFAGISVFYIYDSNKGKLKGKTSNGEGVVYSIGDRDVTASAFYDTLYEENGTAAAYQQIVKTVSDQSTETTEEMKKNAKSQASSIISSYMQNYPTNYKETLASQLSSLGYTGDDALESYLINYFKQEKLTTDYINAHFDDLKVRNISYILVRFDETYETADTADDKKTEDSETAAEHKPTENEQKRMDEADKTLASKTFAEAAEAHSEDPSTAPNGGVLGTVDANTTTLDKAFLEASLALKEGETSDWVYSETFGYFKIHCNASTHDGLVKAYKEQNSLTDEVEVTDSEVYASLLDSYDTTLSTKVVWEKAKELGLTFTDPEMEKKIKTYIGLED